PDDYCPSPIGSRTKVALALRKLFRGADATSDGSFITVTSRTFTIEISTGDEEQCVQLLLHVRGDGDKARKAILRIADHFQARSVDCSTGEFIGPAGSGGAMSDALDQERED